MNNKTDQIRDAIEKIVGKELDTFIVLGFNEEGYTLKAGRGETPAIAVLITDLYKQIPSLEQMVKTTQQLDEGKLPDDLVKALFNILGGNDNE